MRNKANIGPIGALSIGVVIAFFSTGSDRTAALTAVKFLLDGALMVSYALKQSSTQRRCSLLFLEKGRTNCSAE